MALDEQQMRTASVWQDMHTEVEQEVAEDPWLEEKAPKRCTHEDSPGDQVGHFGAR
jgi:hypothetical protein